MQQAILFETYHNNFQVRLTTCCRAQQICCNHRLNQNTNPTTAFCSSPFSTFLLVWQKCSSCKKAIMEQVLLEVTFCRPRTGREAILKHVYTCHVFSLRHISKLGRCSPLLVISARWCSKRSPIRKLPLLLINTTVNKQVSFANSHTTSTF